MSQNPPENVVEVASHDLFILFRIMKTRTNHGSEIFLKGDKPRDQCVHDCCEATKPEYQPIPGPPPIPMPYVCDAHSPLYRRTGTGHLIRRMNAERTCADD